MPSQVRPIHCIWSTTKFHGRSFGKVRCKASIITSRVMASGRFRFQVGRSQVTGKASS